MALMPKRVKYRKEQRRVRPRKATKGNYVAFGEYGLQSLDPGRVSAEVLEASRMVLSRAVRGGGKLYIRVFPHKSITSIPAETRMGKGKGEVDYWAAIVKPGTVLFEVAGIPEARARAAFARVAYKLPVTCRFVARRPTL